MIKNTSSNGTCSADMEGNRHLQRFKNLLQGRTKPRKARSENLTHQVPPPYYSVCCHSSRIKRSEQLTLVRWGNSADLLEKGSRWYADVISLRKFNTEDEILKTYFPCFCASLYYVPPPEPSSGPPSGPAPPGTGYLPAARWSPLDDSAGRPPRCPLPLPAPTLRRPPRPPQSR